MKFLFQLMAVLFALVSALGTANATVYRFSFTFNSTEYIELGGNGATNPPPGIFAYLDFDTTINQFRLYDAPNNVYLGSSVQGLGVGLGLNGIAFDFGATAPVLGAASYPSTGASVFYDNGSMLGLSQLASVPSAIDSNFNDAYKTLSGGSESIADTYKLIAGESETFTISGFDTAALSQLNGATINAGSLVLSAPSVAIRVQSSTGNSASWFAATSVTAVPESETYAMFMVGLGLIGFTAKRCKEA